MTKCLGISFPLIYHNSLFPSNNQSYSLTFLLYILKKSVSLKRSRVLDTVCYQHKADLWIRVLTQEKTGSNKNTARITGNSLPLIFIELERQTRKPRLLFWLFGLLLLRLETDALLALLYQLPPRLTRLLPEEAPATFVLITALPFYIYRRLYFNKTNPAKSILKNKPLHRLFRAALGLYIAKALKPIALSRAIG